MREKSNLILLYEQLATLLKSDIPMHDALNIIAQEGEDTRVQRGIMEISNQLKGGASLENALKSQPALFADHLVTLIGKDSSSAPLAALFSGMANRLATSGQLQRRLVSSLIYPAVILLIALCLLLLMVAYVMPVLKSMYEGIIGSDLPLVTRVVLDFGTFLGGYWLLIPVVLAGAVVLIFFRKKDVLALVAQLPGFSGLLRIMSLADFSGALAVLCTFNISAREMLHHAVESVVHPSLKRHITELADQAATTPDGLAAALAGSTTLPPLFRQMTRIGKETSALTESFTHLADYYETQANRTGRRLILIFDIVAILCVALVVGSLVFAIYLPLFMTAAIV